MIYVAPRVTPFIKIFIGQKSRILIKVGINGFGRIGRLAFVVSKNVEGVDYFRINDLESCNACTSVEI